MKNKVISFPYLVWALVFTLIPLLLIFYYGFTVELESGKIIFSTENFVKFFSNSAYTNALIRSLWMAALATFICLIVGYPVAYILAMSTYKRKGLLLLLLVIPMWMNLLLRTYAWVTILDDTGLINTFLGKFGIKPIQFMYNQGSIVFAMVYNFLPFMILPINSVLSKMDTSVFEAAHDLGANKMKVFTKVTLPLSVPGIFSGITMVFMPAVTTFAITDILSGGKNDLIGNIVQRQFREAFNWHYGATISIILMVLIVISIIVSSKYESEDKGGGLF